MLIANEHGLKENSLKAEFEILSYADSEVDPMNFNISPTSAINLALERAELSVSDVDFFEINEVFKI